MIHRSLLLLLVAACSSGPKPPVKPDPTPRPEPVATADAAPPAIPVAELCPRLIERFRADSGSGSLKPEELEKMVAIVDKHCPTWPESVRTCLVTSDGAAQGHCMDGLDVALRDAFVADMMAAFKTTPDCTELTYDVSAWATLPATVTADDDKAIAFAAIRPAVFLSCDDGTRGWTEEVRTCVGEAGQAGPTAKPRACLDGVPGTVGADLDAQLARRTKLFALAAAFKPTDKKIACAKVVAAHYGDAQWKTKLADRAAADRKKLIKASATALGAACTDEKWTPFVRGCVVAAKTEEERTWCLGGTARWGYPAGSVEPKPFASGVAECDAYAAMVERYAACDKIPPESRTAMKQALDAMRAGWTGMQDDAKAVAGEACTQAMDALKQSAKALGCAL